MAYPLQITTDYDVDKKRVVISVSDTSLVSEGALPLITAIQQAWLEDFCARGVTEGSVTIEIIPSGCGEQQDTSNETH